VEALSGPRPVAKADETVVFPEVTESSAPSIYIHAFVYLWSASQSRLEPTLWSFADFLRDKVHRWVGPKADASEYSEVDKRLAANQAGFPVFEKSGALPDFGHGLRDTFWQFEPGWINLNHGIDPSSWLPSLHCSNG
jgi:hypothetical protein